METPDWLKQHLGHVVGGGSAGAGGAFAFFMLFRDGIKEAIQEWRRSRDEARAERTAARLTAGKPGDTLKELMALMRDEMKASREMLAADLLAQRQSDKEVVALLGQMATANERHLDVERQFSNQFHDVDKQLTEIKTLAGIAATRVQ